MTTLPMPNLSVTRLLVKPDVREPAHWEMNIVLMNFYEIP